MELIRKIKNAEEQARQIVEQAKVDAAKEADSARTQRNRLQVEAEQARTKAIDAAVSKAQTEAQSQVKSLQSQADSQRQELREATDGRKSAAVAKVLKYLRG